MGKVPTESEFNGLKARVDVCENI
jgi:hypothetical protein